MYIIPSNNPLLEQLEVLQMIAIHHCEDLEMPKVTPVNSLAFEQQRTIAAHALRLIPLLTLSDWWTQLLYANALREHMQFMMDKQMQEGF